jgi:hypothetical protein
VTGWGSPIGSAWVVPVSCVANSSCLILDYYDQRTVGFTVDEIQVSNLGSSSTTVALSADFGVGDLTVPAESDEYMGFDSARGGPVLITGVGSLTASQRVIYYDSFSEVYAQSSAATSTQLWLNWYDQESPDWVTDNIQLVNPSASAVTTTVTFGTNSEKLTVPANGIAIANFPGQVGGPVSITSSGPILASARTVYESSFNEVNAVSASQASTKLEFSWYDQYNPGFTLDEIQITNIGTASATVTVSLAGVVKDTVVIGAKAEALVNLGDVEGGPVTISSNVPVIASQRVLYNQSFSEVYAVPASLASTQLVLNWYDQGGNFGVDNIQLVNPSATAATVTVKLGSSTQTVSVAAGGADYVSFPGEVGGPVLITSTVPILASSRTEYMDSFNEVKAVPVP